MKKGTDQIQYLDILREAFSLTWKNRYLWWFGLLASLTSTGSISFDLSSNNGGNDTNNQSAEKFIQLLHDHLEFVILVAVIIFILFIVFAVLAILGRGALIKATYRALQGEKTGFKSGIKESWKYFWRILALDLSVFFSFLMVLVVLVIPVIFLFANNNILAGIMLAIMAFIIMIPIFLLVVFLRMYSYLYVVLGELGFWNSLENAYLLLKNNLAASLVLFLLFIPINLVFFMVIIMIFVPVVVLFFMLGTLAYLAAQNLGIIVVVIIGFLTLLPMLLFIKSIYETFSQAAWIIFFREIASPKTTEKVEEKIPEPKPIVEPDIAGGI